MTITEAGKALNVSRQHIYRLIERGRLHPVRNPLYIKGPVLIPRHEVEELKRA